MAHLIKQHSLVAVLLLTAAPICFAQDVGLDRWLSHMRVSLPVALCARGTAIRTCFTITDEQCEQGIASAARSCIADMKADFPSVIHLPEQGNKLGGDLGECTTEAYAAANQSKYVESPACVAARSAEERTERETK
jgi:hypothetical protein